MSDATSNSGGCLCGSVRFKVAGTLREVWMCHCEDCRRITGNHMAATACDASELTIDDLSTLSWFSRQPGVEYGFCSTCGSTLFWRVLDKPDHVSICAGTLDDTTGIVPGGVLFRAEAGDYAAPHPDVPTFHFDRDTARWSD